MYNNINGIGTQEFPTYLSQNQTKNHFHPSINISSPCNHLNLDQTAYKFIEITSSTRTHGSKSINRKTSGQFRGNNTLQHISKTYQQANRIPIPTTDIFMQPLG